MKRLSIRTRIATSFFLAITLTLLGLGTYLLWFFYDHTVSTQKQMLAGAAHTLEETLDLSMSDSALDDTLKDLAPTLPVRITIIRTDGTVIADSEEDPAAMENHADRPEIVALLADKDGSAFRHSTTTQEYRLYTAVPIIRDGRQIGFVRTSCSAVPIDASYHIIKSTIIGALIAASLLTLLFSFWLAKRYSRPIEEITSCAERIADGDLTARVRIDTGDELEVLAHTLNDLTSHLSDTLQEAYHSLAKLTLVLQNMDNAVIVATPTYHITDANKRAEELFGKKGSLHGALAPDIVDSVLFDAALKEVVHTRAPQSLDLSLTIGDTDRTFHVFCAPICSEDEKLESILAVFSDITARAHIYKRQSEFVSNASHELATPLTSIKGYAETLLDGALDDPALSRRFTAVILQEAERMDRLIKQLLMLARLDRDSAIAELSYRQEPLLPLCETAVRQIERRYADKHHTYIIDVAEVASLYTSADYLHQILTNLLSNGAKYTPSGGTITLSAAESQAAMVFTVTDNGIGMEPHHIPRVFERFYRADKARSRNAGGNGLGLYLVKTLVDLLGGTIDLKSEVGVGTTVTVRLPLAPPSKPVNNERNLTSS